MELVFELLNAGPGGGDLNIFALSFRHFVFVFRFVFGVCLKNRSEKIEKQDKENKQQKMKQNETRQKTKGNKNNYKTKNKMYSI